MKYVSFPATGISFFCLVYFISCCAHISYPFHCLPSAISYLACHIFHYLPGVIYLSISFFALGHFIPTLLDISLLARCNFFYPFHSLPWAISYPPCWIFHCLPGAIFYHFIPCPGAFHSHLIAFFITWQVQFIYPFHSLPRPFHTHPVGFFIACQVRFFLSISFLALGYFIPSSLHFSLLVRCDFLSISFLGLGQFIPTLSHFSLPATSHFHCLPCAISYPFHSLPLVLTISHGLPSVKSALPNMKMHAFPPLHIPPKENHHWFDQKLKKNKIRMILPVRIHPMVCQDDGHMTNYQKWSKLKS